MAREYFCAYHSFLKSLEPLNDAECGRLFRACLEYSKTGTAPELRGNERFVFPMIREQIDRDAEAYRNKCEKLRQNGRLGALANGGNCPQKPPKSPPNAPKDNEEDKDKNNPPSIPPGDDGFEAFWRAYPKRVGKAAALKCWKRIRPGKALQEQILSAVARAKQSEQWTREGGRFIPNPATWLNQGRWEDELPGTEAPPKCTVPQESWDLADIVEYPPGSGNYMPRWEVPSDV